MLERLQRAQQLRAAGSPTSQALAGSAIGHSVQASSQHGMQEGGQQYTHICIQVSGFRDVGLAAAMLLAHCRAAPRRWLGLNEFQMAPTLDLKGSHNLFSPG